MAHHNTHERRRRPTTLSDNGRAPRPTNGEHGPTHNNDDSPTPSRTAATAHQLHEQIQLCNDGSGDCGSSHNSGVVNKEAAIVSRRVGDAKDRVQMEFDGRTGDTNSELSA
ncbi:uncharacterized protein LACBIDRAFT_309604 [Laccaria bicolor S238N-H82]|uniref:Predicted protein n=1 Tax=Laccaria bicolor (strain S238N-H82 / ATCC MYA-4686) TaxID=486041 RepID=B0DSM7_LACBS|nr:uncharacterized protein LACBIDRAFT_309604 [Laccaria bicolor S238N-H82]EDR02261.1 predicted protein [Laccaria bicolor S238N-H82]|eukprot:XP_001886938.1 predicted protein [Laccaria bicolor S238N-H82]